MVDVAAMSEVNSTFPMVCEFYQLRILLDLLKQRFGKGVSGLVEASLVSLLDRRCEDAGVKLFHKFMVAVSNARESGFPDDGPDGIKIDVDFQVADQALEIAAASAEEKRTLRPSLAACLTYARIWAEKICPSVVAQVEFDPESIALIEIETAYNGLTNRWRENPGCFERHLQRMEGNPLFRESDRNPSNDDIARMRARDDDDLDQLRLDFELLGADLKMMGKTAQARTVIDVMRYRVAPLKG
jgi:hypothetical protein